MLWRTKPKHGITGSYRSQVFFPFLLFFPSFFLSFFLSFFFSLFFLSFPLSFLWVTGPGRPRTKRPMWRSPKRHNGQSAYEYAPGAVYIQIMLLEHIELRILPQIIHAPGAEQLLLEHNFGTKSICYIVFDVFLKNFSFYFWCRF